MKMLIESSRLSRFGLRNALRKAFFLIPYIYIGMLLASCADMLDSTNTTKQDTSTFPSTQKDAEQLVTGIYSAIGPLFETPQQVNIFAANELSDDMYGGGSETSFSAQAEDRLMMPTTEGMDQAWKYYFQGVFRCNFALSVIPQMHIERFDTPDYRNYLVGQVYFMRAFYLWQLYDLFETFPLTLSVEPQNLPRASVYEIMTQISADLLEAIELMPASYGYSRTDNRAGRATRYAAEALLARVWMFYTGFYHRPSLNGISKDDIIAYLQDVASPRSGFGLESDPRVIWPYTNDYSSGCIYELCLDIYSARNDLHWVGNHSRETIFATHFSLINQSAPASNQLSSYYALRNVASKPDERSYPYGIGYANGTVNPRLVEDWISDPDYGPQDKRIWGSVLSVRNAHEVYAQGGAAGTNWWPQGVESELKDHVGDDAHEVEKTLLHNKKYIVSVCYSNSAMRQLYENFFYAYPNFQGENSSITDNRNDLIYIRYADVLLMLDELQGTVTGMNQLRQRAGLEPYPYYTFDRLQRERRYELCFEGLRFNDMRRWYPETAGAEIARNQLGGYIEYHGHPIPGGYAEIPGNGLQKRYRETRGFWKISNTQITLSEETLTETPGWNRDNDDQWLFTTGALPYERPNGSN